MTRLAQRRVAKLLHEVERQAPILFSLSLKTVSRSLVAWPDRRRIWMSHASRVILSGLRGWEAV
jgi:hypothetical protein